MNKPVDPYKRDECWLCDMRGEIETFRADDTAVTVGCPVCVQNDHEWLRQKAEQRIEALTAELENRSLAGDGSAASEHYWQIVELLKPHMAQDGLPESAVDAVNVLISQGHLLKTALEDIETSIGNARENGYRLEADTMTDAADIVRSHLRSLPARLQDARMGSPCQEVRIQQLKVQVAVDAIREAAKQLYDEQSIAYQKALDYADEIEAGGSHE